MRLPCCCSRARDLKPQGERKGESGRVGALSVVAWSPDGGALYAGGTYGDAGGHKFVRRWRFADQTDIAVSDDTVTALAGLADGFAFASAEPAWGKIGADGKPVFRHDRQYADFRDGEKGFAVSADGAAVEFGFAQGGKSPARFDVLAGTLELDPKAQENMHVPATTGFADWRNGDKPKLNGRVLALDEHEKARSAAAAGDLGLLGTDFFLRAYRNGDTLWRTAIPAAAWAVNMSADRRLAVAGLGDGTIRWYRLADGVEILSFFAEPDGKHWVLWTPEGFFDHGEGGEQLIGYHLNQLDQGRPKGAAFVRVDQLYALFFRRDLVVQKFRGDAEPEIAAQLARIGDVRSVLGKGLPPELKLTEYCIAGKCEPIPADEQSRSVGGKVQLREAAAPEVVLHFEVQDRGGGVGPIVVRDKGATVTAAGGIARHQRRRPQRGAHRRARAGRQPHHAVGVQRRAARSRPAPRTGRFWRCATRRRARRSRSCASSRSASTNIPARTFRSSPTPRPTPRASPTSCAATPSTTSSPTSMRSC